MTAVTTKPARYDAGRTGWFLPTFVRALTDQLRMHASSPMAVFSTLAMPCVFAFVVHANASGGGAARETTGDMAVGSAGIGMLDSIIVLVVVSLMGEKQWKTLYAALGSPGGLVPVVLGRLTGTAVQSLTALPGTLVILVLLFGLGDGFDWTRWLIGGVLLAFSTASVVGLLGFAVLRYPYSAGMTNGLTGLVMALSALIVPQSALPGPVQKLAFVIPQSHVMAWVRGGGTGELLAALALTGVFCGLVVLAVRRLELIARRQALPLEA
ncbi:ABC transporter permease [Streptomyces sp. NBC_01408]|uniref:ABC transporter permease n=1 Tax=Streptomyces sp. NBC_01408 TaxID=2903855 RepID=UPI00224E49A0|nr:ABC transporter permease [Streptomyces sp. NBC_01408]MCX4692831.1 ABC transporter permease [Streptomyces sp. NBC_01408]